MSDHIATYQDKIVEARQARVNLDRLCKMCGLLSRQDSRHVLDHATAMDAIQTVDNVKHSEGGGDITASMTAAISAWSSAKAGVETAFQMIPLDKTVGLLRPCDVLDI